MAAIDGDGRCRDGRRWRRSGSAPLVVRSPPPAAGSGAVFQRVGRCCSGDRGWWCGCLFFSLLPSLSFWASTKTSPGKGLLELGCVCGLRPTDCFSMGPKEWTAWETSWPENGMQMGPFSGTATDGGVLSAALVLHTAPPSPSSLRPAKSVPSGDLSPFQVSLCAESHSPSIWGAPLYLVVWDGAIRGSNGRTFKSSSSPLPLSAELRHSASNEAPPSPPQRYVPQHSLILYILYMCHISKLTVGD